MKCFIGSRVGAFFMPIFRKANPVQTLDEYREEIIRNMRSVGTYKDSFANTVDAYARAMMDYDTACESFEKLGSKFMVKHTNRASLEKAQRYICTQFILYIVCSFDEIVKKIKLDIDNLNN